MAILQPSPLGQLIGCNFAQYSAHCLSVVTFCAKRLVAHVEGNERKKKRRQFLEIGIILSAFPTSAVSSLLFVNFHDECVLFEGGF